jgi:hypothetical protein
VAKTQEQGWSLEVVRGQEVGRSYPLRPGAMILGNALNGEAGIDLAAQEGTSPRRMAPRQARLESTATGLTLLDLDSPGGTFVNRQRILPGQARTLGAGDVIQVGAVQLRVVAAATKPQALPSPTPVPAASAAHAVRPGPLPAPFTLANGTVCRSWDDFLTVSAQSWSSLREELGTGRLAKFLSGIGRTDLLPSGTAASLDDALDAWIGRLPSARPAAPDLEVHPMVVRVRGGTGGGTTRQKIAITNTGYRLLRTTIRVEPPSPWIRLGPEFTARAFSTAEQTEVPFELQVPETLAGRLEAALVVESNGGTRRVSVSIEPPAKSEVFVDTGPARRADIAAGFRERLAGYSPGRRILFGAVGLGVLRGLLSVGDALSLTLGSNIPVHPSLGGSALVLAALGALAGLRVASRKGEATDLPACAFAGAFSGILLAALGVAACRATEPGFGWLPPFLLWLGMGALAAVASLALVPFRPNGEERP